MTTRLDVRTVLLDHATTYLTKRRQQKKTEPEPEHTSGIVCLVPAPESARKLVLTGKGAEPAKRLHLTLAYLGDNVTSWPAEVRDELVPAVRSALNEHPGGPLAARVFGHTTFNPDGGPAGDRDPCAVYMIGDSDRLQPLQAAVVEMLGDVDGLALPTQHTPFVPHVTATYAGTAADLSYTGPIVFDRVAVVLGPRWTYLPLATTRGDA